MLALAFFAVVPLFQWAASASPTRTNSSVQFVCPTITVGTPASGLRFVPYSSSVAATAVPTPPAGFSFRYSLASGALPDGLSLNTTTGAITGTPPNQGVFSFGIKAELFDATNTTTGCSITQTRSISILCEQSFGCRSNAVSSFCDPTFDGQDFLIEQCSPSASCALDDQGLPRCIANPSGRVWMDSNRNGVQDAGEPGIQGATVTMINAGANGIFGDGDDRTASATTDSNGIYLITPPTMPEPNGAITGGNVRFIVSNLPAGFTPTFDPDSGTTNPDGIATYNNVPQGMLVTNVHFGFAQSTQAPTLGASLTDPAVCTGPGGVVNVTAQVGNPNNVPLLANFTATLPAQLLGLAGTGAATVNQAGLSVTATQVTWSGTLQPNQTVTITYQAQIADATPAATQLCVNSTATLGGVAAQPVSVCLTVNCPPVGPGALPNGQNAVSDQKPGSVLVYPVYTSDAANANAQNTRLAITNTNPTRTAFLHLFFVDGNSCSVADSFICLTPNQTAAVLASDIDPGTTGYVIAVASDRNGCLINFNWLIGDEYVKFASGHQANLAAESVAAIAGGLPACDLISTTAQLNFDNVSYNALPRVLAASSLPARGDGNDTLLIVNRIGGNLATGAATLGTLFGLLYDDAEKAYSFSLTASTCQSRGSLTNDRPRTVPRYETVIGLGRTGWLKLWGGTDIGLLGAQINRNANAASNPGAFNQGHNLHKLTLTTTANVTIPIFPPTC